MRRKGQDTQQSLDAKHASPRQSLAVVSCTRRVVNVTGNLILVEIDSRVDTVRCDGLNRVNEFLGDFR